jgi:hypothetical protein
MNPLSFATVIKYTSTESVGKNSSTDIALGYINNKVGSNRSIGKMNTLPCCVFVILEHTAFLLLLSIYRKRLCQ